MYLYSEGLEIAGVGVGMVFLALVVILAVTLILRTGIDWRQRWQVGRSLATAPTIPEGLAPQIEAPEGTLPTTDIEPAKPAPARAAAIAVALFLAEEEEGERGET